MKYTSHQPIYCSMEVTSNILRNYVIKGILTVPFRIQSR